jgi:hypothetical protein
MHATPYYWQGEVIAEIRETGDDITVRIVDPLPQASEEVQGLERHRRARLHAGAPAAIHKSLTGRARPDRLRCADARPAAGAVAGSCRSSAQPNQKGR